MPFKDKSRRDDYMRGYMQQYLKRRYDERWPIAVNLLGGQCVQCGATERLQFDHIDPRDKRFEIADRLAQYAWPRLMVELSKCQLLCERCHIAKGKADTDAGRHPQAARRAQRAQLGAGA